MYLKLDDFFYSDGEGRSVLRAEKTWEDPPTTLDPLRIYIKQTFQNGHPHIMFGTNGLILNCQNPCDGDVFAVFYRLICIIPKRKSQG